MDEAEENFDVSAAAEAPGADGDSLLNPQSSGLESGADFNLDALLDAAGTENAASAEDVFGNGTEDAGAVLNAVDEEESAADLNMDAWLAGADGTGEAFGASETEAVSDTLASLGNDGADFSFELPAADGEISAETPFSGETAADVLPQADGTAAKTEDAAAFGPVGAMEETAGGEDAAEKILVEDTTAAETVIEEPSSGGWLAEESVPAPEETEPVAAESAAGGGWLADSETPEDTPVSENAWLAGGENSAEEVSEENSFAPEAAKADLNTSDEPASRETEEGGALPAAEGEADGGASWLNAANEAEQPAEEDDFSEENSLAGENPLFEAEMPSFAETAGAEENAFSLSGAETAAAAAVVDAAANGGAAAESNANFVKWYSGSVHDEMFEISKNDLPETISGDAARRIIHVNAGYDSYGWLAEFDNGLTMSLEDVRKYQIRNGALPSSSGAIRYGQNRCAFSGIERILIYRSVRYFSYGA